MGMDTFLARSCAEAAPKANLDILNGITSRQMEFYADNIDKIWTTVAKDFPPQVRYKGFRYSTPDEEFMNEPRSRRGSGREADVAPNNIRMAQYKFEFLQPTGKWEEFPPVYMFLPYTSEQAGLLWLSGGQWSIAPMLGDQVLSFEKDRVFCQLSRAKFHIENVNHLIHIDGVCYEFNVPWSVLYNINSTKASLKISLLHYVLATRGLRKTMEYVLPQMKVLFFDEMPDEEKYPMDQWVYITGSKLQTKPFYGGSKVVTLVERKAWEEAPLWTRTVMASLYFTLDRFSPGGSEFWGGEMKADPSYSESIERWRLLMGLVLWERSKNPGIIIDDINKHMSSLDRYIDDLVRPRAYRIGFRGENLYDFFSMIIQAWEDWRLNSYKKSAPVYDKEINVLYQVSSKIMQAIFYFYFALENEANKGALTYETVRNLLKTYIKPRMIFSIRNDAHRYVAPISYSGDNAFCKISAIVVPQRGNSSGGEGQGAAATRLHASLSEVTSPINLTKKESTGLTRLNPFVRLSGLMYIERDPEVVPLTEAVQKILDQEMRSGGEDDIDVDGINDLERMSRHIDD